MSKLATFSINDFEAARLFVKSLPASIREARFPLNPHTGQPPRWQPDHCVLVAVGGRYVALADCIVGGNGAVANGSIVACGGQGAYAIQALVVLKKVAPAGHWEAGIMNPTQAVISIARRYFDSIYDQIAWDLGQLLGKKFGQKSEFYPSPVIASKFMLNHFGFRSLAGIDIITRQRILVAAQQFQPSLLLPNGRSIGMQDMFVLAFEFLEVPMKDRQSITRMQLFGLGAQLGIDWPKIILDQFIDQKAVHSFFATLVGRQS